MLAQALVERLELAGQSCWIAPRDVVSGIPYPRQLVQAIDSCGTFLLLVTPHSADSEHVLREVEQAAKRQRSLLPVVVDGAMSTDLDYFIGSLHQITGSTDQVVRYVVDHFGDSTQEDARVGGWTSAAPDCLKVGVIPFPPFSQHPVNGRVSGYYVSLLDEYAEEAGTEIEYRPITNDSAVGLLDSREIDAVACLYRTPRRSARYQFAACFYASTVTGVVRSDEVRITNQRHLMDDDVRIAVCKGEVGAELAQDVFRATAGSSRLIEVDTVDVKAIAAMVAMGMADVAITDTVTCDLIVESSPIPLKEIFVRRPLFVGHIGLMLAQHNTGLASNLDTKLAEIRSRHKLQALEDEIVLKYPDLLEVL